MCNFVCGCKTVPYFAEDGLGGKVSSSLQAVKVLRILSTLKVSFAMQLAVKGGRQLTKCFNAQEDEGLLNFY